MAKKASTRTLSPEELRGFLDSRARTQQFNNYQQNQRNRFAAVRDNAESVRAMNGGAGPQPQEASLTGNADFDNAIHVGGRALDILGALGYGAQARLDRQLDDAEKLRETGDLSNIFSPDKLLSNLGAGLDPAFYKGVGDALTGNQKDLKHGFENIEKTADVYGSDFDKDYKDVQDNVHPVAKGIGGFALDVAMDPLTFAPAGPIAKAVEGGFKASVGAARAAKGGDVAKTAAFFNPVTAAKGAGAGVREWGEGVKNTIQSLRRDVPTNPVLEEALQNLAPRAAAQTAGAAAKKAPATAARGTKPEEVQLPAAEVRATTGVAEGARAAEAVAEAVDAPAPRSIPESGEGVAIPQTAPAADPLLAKAEDAAAKVAEKTVRTQQLGDLAPDIARAADASARTTDVLANLRGLTYTANRFPTHLQRKIEQLTPMTDRRQVKEWTAAAAELVGEDGAKALRKISDPEEFAAAAKELARERTVNTMNGRTPDDLFRKLRSNRNEFNPAAVREVASLLGLKSIPAADANWKTFSDFLRRSDPKGVYNEMKRQELINRGLLGGSDLPGAAVAEAAAKNIDPEGAKVAAAEAADDLITPQARQEYDDALAGVFPAGFEKAYRFQNHSSKNGGENFHTATPKFGPDAKPVSSHVFNQNHQLTLWKNLFEQAQLKFKSVPGAQRQDFLYDYLMDGLRYTDLRLRSLGIAPVSKALGAESKLLKNGGDAAFLSFADVLDAMPPETVKALLLAGKDINVPITLLSDTARHALRLSETDMDSITQAQTLLHALQERLQKEFAAGTKKDTTKWLQDPKNTAILKAVAGAFTDPSTVQRLAEANVRNLAFATAVNGQQAWRALKPIVETLRQFALDPNVSAGKQIDAVLGARAAADAMIKKTGIKDTPAGEMAEQMLDVETAKATSSASTMQAKNALGQDRAVVDGSGQQVTETARSTRKQKATDAAAAANAPGKTPAKPKAEKLSETAKKGEIKTKEKANTARTNEHVSALPTVDEIVEAARRDAESVIDDPVTDFMGAHAAFSMDLPGWLRTAFKGAEKMDGWFGKADVKPFAISAEMNSQNMIHKYTRALNDVTKAHDPAAIKGAIALFKGMDGNAGLDVALEGAPQGVADAARSLWPTFSQVFDHSEHGLMQRIGMEGAYLNDYLRRQGMSDNFLLAGTQSWENGSAWTQWNWDTVENPLAILDGYHRAIVKAQVVPDVAANFSAAFGNKSTQYGKPISADEARAAGWTKVSTNGGRTFGLFHFVDKDQYYPKEMLTQLALMDDYFNASRTLDEKAVFDNFFRYADPVVNSLKASITLWRPGHHVTNIMGEFLMNTLAGVKNPMRYADAYNIMAAAGKVDGQSMDSLQKYLRAAAPEGVQLKEAAAGIPVTIRGQQVTLSHEQVYQLLDQSGAIIHHNQAEDLINEGTQVVGRNTRESMSAGPAEGSGGAQVQKALHKLNQFAAPGWLGNFSANRDNVFRIAHAADILQKGNFGSVEDAMSAVTKEINSYHPNMLTLGATEQKYVRRLIYFYTWQRQALTRIAISMVDTPGRIMIAPKALYNISAAAGADPDSWGDPVPDEGSIPDYLRGNIGQWMFLDGMTNESPADQSNYLWGMSLNAPQLDILQSVLGSVAVDPEKSGFEQAGDTLWQLTSKNLLQNMTPLFRIPAELGTHAQMGTGIPIQEGEEGQYLLNQTGIRGPLLFTGLTPPDKNDSPEITQMKRENALFNWGTGMKKTLYNGPEQHAIWLRQQQEKMREEAESAG